MKFGLFLISLMICFSVSSRAANTTRTTKCYWGMGKEGGGPINDNAWTELKADDSSLMARNFYKIIENAGYKYTVRAQLQYAHQHDLTLFDYTISKEGPKGYKPLVAANAVFVVASSIVADDGRVALKCE